MWTGSFSWVIIDGEAWFQALNGLMLSMYLISSCVCGTPAALSSSTSTE